MNEKECGSQQPAKIQKTTFGSCEVTRVGLTYLTEAKKCIIVSRGSNLALPIHPPRWSRPPFLVVLAVQVFQALTGPLSCVLSQLTVVV